MKFTIGADPELFLADNTSIRSVIGKVGGTKTMPQPLPLGEGYAVQEDNVALEFCIPACTSKAGFIKAICDTTSFLESAMKDAYGYHFDKRSAVSFPDTELDHPNALEFGCDPDYNAWTKCRNPRPKATDKRLRSAGGHIHIGFEGYDPHDVIKAMDLFAGVPSVLLDKGDLRRQLYGKAGAFRVKPYGAEYRTLSNFWIFDPSTIAWAYDAVDRALRYVETGVVLDDERANIIAAIDNNDKEVASALVAKYKLGAYQPHQVAHA